MADLKYKPKHYFAFFIQEVDTVDPSVNTNM